MAQHSRHTSHRLHLSPTLQKRPPNSMHAMGLCVIIVVHVRNDLLGSSTISRREGLVHGAEDEGLWFWYGVLIMEIVGLGDIY